MRQLLLLLLIVVIASCSLKSEKARVKLPGTNLVLVLEEDEKRMTRYHFVVDGVDTAEGILGPPNRPLDGKVAVSDNHGVMRLSWGPEGTMGQFIVIDTNACRIVEHSNSSDPPPRITGCARHAPAA
jgi:hypothetical protein